MTKLLITGAAGNLGGLLAHHLSENYSKEISLRLLYHNKLPDSTLLQNNEIHAFKADLSDPNSLTAALQGIDTVIHFAGVLFKHHPEKFLHTTNTQYFKNLLSAAVNSGVKRIILISFPHVEGPSSPEHPARGRLDGKPLSVHAQTRLEEEKLLFSKAAGETTVSISLRVGMVYGKGILMIEAAKWFSRHGLLGIWKQPTGIHLISTIDFLEACAQAIIKENIKGIYHLGDEGKQSLQEFLDAACQFWGTKKPVRMPAWLVRLAALHFEWASLLFGVRSPLTGDFVTIGMVPYYGDTESMRRDLLPKLKYPCFQDGIDTL